MSTIRRARIDMERAVGGPAALIDALRSLRRNGIITGYRLTEQLVLIEGDAVAMELAVGHLDAEPAPEERLPVPATFPVLEPVAPLPEKWRKRLADSGFVDIERPDGSLAGSLPGSYFSPRKGLDSKVANHKWQDVRGTRDYYTRALAFCHSKAYREMSPDHRQMWRYHAQGVSNREISRLMGKVSRTVDRIINRTKKELK